EGRRPCGPRISCFARHRSRCSRRAAAGGWGLSRAGHSRLTQPAWMWMRAAVVAVLVVLLAAVAEPGYAGGPAALSSQAAADLWTVRADGVTLVDALSSFGQANAYAFRVGDGPGTVQLYVGDLWYDV